jgi:carbon monoxide dehydrogenase subunit G
MKLRSLALVAAVAIGALLAYAATRPDTFRVERRTSVQATPEQLYPLINDMQQFNTWNPFNRKDPAIQGSYSGPAAGPGATYAFAGNKDVGKGSLRIVQSQPPRQVTMELHMIEPFEGRNTVEFSLVPRGAGTEVTWAMHGPAPFLSKLIGVFLDMDRMIGRDFEDGLAALKARAEKA